MKYCFALFFAPLMLHAQQDYVNGQSARVVVGQSTFTSQDPGATQRLLGAAGGVAYANNMLFVADDNRIAAVPSNNRVLIYRDVRNAFPAPSDVIPFSKFLRCAVCTGSTQLPYGAADVVVGQPDFTKVDLARTQAGLRLPTAVASDGNILVVADTDNNRVLIWKNVPSSNGAPADLVLGASNFTTLRAGVLDNKSFRGPQGVWIQGTRLFVADTQNHRVMVWNNIPTQSDQPADYVLGQANFTTTSEREIQQQHVTPVANRLLNPVSVSSDGQRLFVADLGYQRVLIWNTIPTRTETPADVVLGQPDMISEIDNNSSKQCASNGVNSTDSTILLYPTRCAGTLSWPRFALSDGTRLFVADGGNDRVLIWNTIPTVNGTKADLVIGQPDFNADVVTDNSDFFTPNLLRGAPNTTRTPTSLAWDGTNLYVATPYDRRVMVFTPGLATIKQDGVRNAASRNVYAVGVISVGGTITEGDTISLLIGTVKYTYTILKEDRIATVIQKLVNLINAGEGDPSVIARANFGAGIILLTSRKPGTDGNSITLIPTLTGTGSTSTTPVAATITLVGGTPTGGGDATRVAPGGANRTTR